MSSTNEAIAFDVKTVAVLRNEIEQRLHMLLKKEGSSHPADKMESQEARDALSYISQLFPMHIRTNQDDSAFDTAALFSPSSDAMLNGSMGTHHPSLRETSPQVKRFPSQSNVFTPMPMEPFSFSADELDGLLGAGLPAGEVSDGPMVSAQGQGDMNVDVGLVNRLSPMELDALPYGVVQLDARGKVVGYNDTESRMVGIPKESVLGRNFFKEVAPCTRVKAFEGRFRDMVEGRSRKVIEQFEFVFNFEKGAQRVVIMIFRARRRGIYNIAMIRR